MNRHFVLIIINGPPRAGKDTFVEMCEEVGARCFNLSTINYIKDLAEELGWDGTKTPKNRKFLSDLKDLLTEWDDIPFKEISKEIDSCYTIFEHSKSDVFVFVHCREPKEIAKLVSEFDYFEPFTVLVDRKNDEKISNHADSEIYDYIYDYYIDNNGSLDDLRAAAETFLEELEEEITTCCRGITKGI